MKQLSKIDLLLRLNQLSKRVCSSWKLNAGCRLHLMVVIDRKLLDQDMPEHEILLGIR